MDYVLHLAPIIFLITISVSTLLFFGVFFLLRREDKRFGLPQITLKEYFKGVWYVLTVGY